ncbi:MAG: anhydro-N-acetylmuramic acid kinase, partial [Planctomycetota bacterium]|nr:anhydro-N-acetylmuramic acid kinase [Planctomycetota bacterium]
SEISSANFWLGGEFAKTAAKVKGRFDLIGSHGQTIWHDPGRSTLQIGEPAIIAEKTGITVVADFRPADIALGGEGAPLVPHFDRAFFGKSRKRALLNIGGIANVTFPSTGLAFDTGPGNCLIDDAVRRMGKGFYDKNGKMARTGLVDRALLKKWKAHPYFRKKAPKSTGRELFSAEWVGKKPDAGTVATLTLLTAETIARGIENHAPEGLEVVVVSGGGVYNRTLMELLEALLWPVAVRSSQMYGLDPMAKEAAAFALLAYTSISGKKGNVPASTGAGRAAVLGKIVPGVNYKRLMRKVLS